MTEVVSQVVKASGRWLNSLVLGLPVALLAHIVVFGHQHAAGATLHNLVLGAAAIAICAVIGLRARHVVIGRTSRAAAKKHAVLEVFLPAIAGAGWFSTIELCERQHAVPILATAAAVAIVAILVRALVHACAQLLAGIAVALLASIFVRRSTASARITLRVDVLRIPCALAHSLRLFSRPPPAFS